MTTDAEHPDPAAPPSPAAPELATDAQLVADDEAPGGFDLGALFETAQGMQQQLLEAQAALAETEVEGSSGGGAVTVRVTGDFRFTGVTIDPAAVDLDDIGMLEDLVLAALHDASANITALQASAGGMDLGGLDLGGLDLGGLGGLFGGS